MTPLLMFAALFVLVFAGIPVAFSLIIIAVGFGYTVFGDLIFLQLYGPLLHTASNFVLAAIPLFIFMGAVLERSGIAKRLFFALQLWLGGAPGGLALSTIAMCAIFAAASGVVGAVEIVVGLMAIPAMMKAKYKNDLIAGTICAGGSLGTIIPPSVIVVVYASIAQLSIGQLFAASILPGLLMVLFFVGYILFRSVRNPADAPPLPPEERSMPLPEKLKITFTALVPPLALIGMVLGSLLMGAASATEAAAVGAAGTLILTMLFRELNLKLLMDSLGVTLRITAMIMLIVAGGTMFTSIFAVTGGGNLVRDTVETIGYGNAGIITFFLLVVFFAGFVLDWVSIVLIFIPIFAPIVRSAGIDPIWFAMMVLVVIQTSYLTPPMAPSIFYLRSIAPRSMTYGQMYRGVLPFVGAQMLVLLVIILFPAIATWLPSILVGL
ncbi:TRAP transporter large permease [Parasedimentitalea huanghaiensis]|uniref:TRAP transporter large permease protein n=1 Tax=Parasedimentitalea huanghaiensis TaxID=2682100 RepID=A0A6L6WF40_9RHOB|nr:TRAP transporter large permease subunit [Zongyanglinia huanghaiensis]MVO16466.1 TRAP transporter large permease subunit [Zongyanglinia huanghaiensis]